MKRQLLSLRAKKPVATEAKPRVLLVGKENVGKTQVAAGLTDATAHPSNFSGATIECTSFDFDGELELIDSPGIVRHSDTQTTASLVDQLTTADHVLVVVQGTNLDADLADVLPLVAGKRGAIIVTFWDKVAPTEHARAFLHELSYATGVPVVALNARQIGQSERDEVRLALREESSITVPSAPVRSRFRVEPRATLLERPRLGPILGLTLMLLPAVVAVWIANTFAGLLDPLVQRALNPALTRVEQSWPTPLAELLAGPYSVLRMGPLLLVWAMPTVVAFAFMMGALKASGLMDRIAGSIDRLVRPFGLGGRDVLRVVMGFGCNVPAVLQTRSSSSCSRDTCISAIAFGSACSYQLGATLAVFSAVGAPGLVVPYLMILLLSLLAYTRLTAPPEARSKLNRLLLNQMTFLRWPDPASTWRESRLVLSQFVRKALPIFIGISVLASLLDMAGVIDAVEPLLRPVMALFHLPAEAAPAVLFAAIRKDGLLLLSEPGTADALDRAQVLTAVLLGGTLVPCLVTALTIARERSIRVATRIIGRQMMAATAASMIVGWGLVALAAAN